MPGTTVIQTKAFTSVVSLADLASQIQTFLLGVNRNNYINTELSLQYDGAARHYSANVVYKALVEGGAPATLPMQSLKLQIAVDIDLAAFNAALQLGLSALIPDDVLTVTFDAINDAEMAPEQTYAAIVVYALGN